MRKTVFVKVSGDLVSRRDVVDWIKKLAKEFFVVVCIGGGAHINEEFEKRGHKIKFGPLGREVENFQERQLARNILEKNQARVQDLLAKNKVPAMVIIPVIDIGSVLCHLNGDVFTQAAYLGFDELYVLTYKNRVKAKKETFKKLPKIKIICFPEKI